MYQKFKLNENATIKEKEIKEILEKTKAVLPENPNIHYELIAGNHSSNFFSFTRVSQWPKYVSLISKDIVEWTRKNLDNKKVDVVLSHATRGQIIAFDIARTFNGTMNTRAVEAQIDDCGNTLPKLRPVQNILKNENILIVTELTTTGSSINTLIDLARKYEANIIGICVFVTRNTQALEAIQNHLNDDTPIYSLVEFDWEHYSSKETCKYCQEGIKVIHSKDIR